MKKIKGEKNYLAEFLKIAPLSHALWRAVEALSFDQIELKNPALDLGCGFGEFSGVVFGKVETGIDINKKELADALKNKKYNKVVWADARALPFAAKSYSTVIAVSVLEHIENAEIVIKEVGRILKKAAPKKAGLLNRLIKQRTFYKVWNIGKNTAKFREIYG